MGAEARGRSGRIRWGEKWEREWIGGKKGGGNGEKVEKEMPVSVGQGIGMGVKQKEGERIEGR